MAVIFFLFRILLLVGKSEIENIIYFMLYIFGIKKTAIAEAKHTKNGKRRRKNSLNFLYFFFFFSTISFFDVEQKRNIWKLWKKASKTYIYKIHEKRDVNITRHIKIIIKENGC